jgi:AcrR family transcriptional regulator
MNSMTQRFGTRREKNKAETRRIIFETAYALLEEKGYEKMTMRELAAKAGVGIGTIFQHFKDKSALLVSVFEHDFHPLVRKTFETIPARNLKKQLLYMVRNFYDYYARRPKISRILANELYLKPENFERISQSLQDDISRIAMLFDSAKKRGEIDPNTNSADAVLIWWSYYFMVLLQGLQHPHFNVDEQVAVHARLIDQHFSGIKRRD